MPVNPTPEGGSHELSDDELTAAILKVYPMAALVHLRVARAAIAADRAARIVRAEPWLKSGEVAGRLKDQP